MNSLGNVRLSASVEDETDDGSHRTDTLIKAALSLSQAIEALGTLNFLGELRLPDVRQGIDFYAQVRGFESALILEALRLSHGKQKRASSLLGLNPTTLNCMIKRLGIDAESLAAGETKLYPRGHQRTPAQRDEAQPPRRDLAHQ
jgi:transcriptional regulator with GAF, ATPase, and Fis domain